MFKTPDQLEARREAEIHAGREINHIQEMVGITMDDTCECSCGWRSSTYHDGQHWAFEEWVKHIQEHGAEIAYPAD